MKIQALLARYEKASGQKINMNKTSMIFSGNVSIDRKKELLQLWGVIGVQEYERYLGLPPAVGRSKTKDFIEIKQRVWQKLQSWKENLLSQGGREILIKAVALSMPTYSMSCYLLVYAQN
ncbi:hypothetical protein F2P56_037076 [Juglans regia]|uniref:Uncharacterized protein n=1 Tax=Juglans regia TaxID=51240 RepID=A0A833WSI7_JUGRE|nr:hypothetical protein F2P56_037076 [Juglans regia]